MRLIRHILIVLLLSGILFAGGCAANRPKAFCPKCRGTIVVQEESFSAQADFGGEKKLVILGSEKNVFRTRYTFSGDKVELQHNTIQTELEQNALPDTNLALIMFRVLEGIEGENTKWEKRKDSFAFTFKINDVYCSGTCDLQGKLLSFELPAYEIYFKSA